MSPLVIVLIVIIVMLVLGGGGCLLCVGVAALSSAGDQADASRVSTSSSSGGSTESSATIESDLKSKLRTQGVPADSVRCPARRGTTFKCDLTVGNDTAIIEVRDNGSGFAFDVPNTAFLDGAKLQGIFDSSVNAKLGGTMRAPCFVGTLMKHVGSDFSCPVFAIATGAAVGQVTTTVDTAKGDVHMLFVPSNVPNGQPTSRSGPRIVNFTCPAGQRPGGAVRGGCLCGNQILGTACGRSGNFTEVTETQTGCRFTCAD